MTVESEIAGGHQSRIFLATAHGRRWAIKCIEAVGDTSYIRARIELTRRLADVNPAVVGPEPLASDLIIEVDGLVIVGYPYITGTRPDVDTRADVEAMATTLAELHESLSSIADVELPPVAALRFDADSDFHSERLIHGDYAAGNLINTPTGIRVIDFDDCGTGSTDFELGNTLYMAMFDAWHRGDLARYRRFRSWFVDHYRQATATSVNDDRLDAAIRIRVNALKRWLLDPVDAPVGIRSADPAWRRELARFIGETSSPPWRTRLDDER